MDSGSAAHPLRAAPRPGHEGIDMTGGLRKGLTSYGDEAFSLFLRKAFIKAKGYSDDALERPIAGIPNTFSDSTPCPGTVPPPTTARTPAVLLLSPPPPASPPAPHHHPLH